MSQTVYKSLLFASVAVLVVGLVTFFVFGQTIKWVGETDIEVRFVVTDDNTGQPIPNATIHIRTEAGGFCEDPPQESFTITTDEKGHAESLAINCMCFGSKGVLEDTFASHLPRWSIYATATGYSASEPTFLDVSENARQVQRGEPFATLSFSIRLREDSVEQTYEVEPE